MKASEVAAALREVADALDTVEVDIVTPALVFGHYDVYNKEAFLALVKAFNGATRFIDGQNLRISLTSRKALIAHAYITLDLFGIVSKPVTVSYDFPESIMRIPEGK